MNKQFFQFLLQTEAHHLTDTEERRDRARRAMFLQKVCFIFVASGMFMAVLRWMQGAVGQAILTFVLSVMISAAPWILKTTHSTILAGNWIIFHTYCFLVHNIYLYGVRFTGGFAWIVAIPVIATILGKRRSGVLWTVMVALVPFVYYTLKRAGLDFPGAEHEAAPSLVNAISLSLLAGMLAYCVFLYEAFNEESKDFIRSLTMKDELTKLYNRRGFLVLAEEMRKIAKRENEKIALIYIDLDKFKPINDKYGHEEGDFALRDFSNIVMHAVRESDVVARIGGDEFVVAGAVKAEGDAQVVIDRIGAAVDDHNRKSSKPYKLLFSHGFLAAKPGELENIEELLTRADRHMLERKRTKAGKR